MNIHYFGFFQSYESSIVLSKPTENWHGCVILINGELLIYLKEINAPADEIAKKVEKKFNHVKSKLTYTVSDLLHFVNDHYQNPEF